MATERSSAMVVRRNKPSLGRSLSLVFRPTSKPVISHPSLQFSSHDSAMIGDAVPPATAASTPAAAAGPSRLEAFCAHPIKKTGTGFRKFFRRASVSIRSLSYDESAKLGRSATRSRIGRGKTPVGDGESGIVLNENDTGDSFYAVDESVVRKDFVRILPSELTAQIMSYLDHNALLNCERVSKSWNVAARDWHVWRQLYQSAYGPWPSKPDRQWKKMYSVREEVSKRWQNPLSVHTKKFVGHSDSVYCVQFDDNKIITGSRDRTIRVWDIKSGLCTRVLSVVDPADGCALAVSHANNMAHTASVLCLQFDETIMVSGSSDHSCIVWSLPSYRPLGRLNFHTAGVLDVCFDDKYIVSCSKDTTICVWSRKTLRLLHQLRGHRGPVNAVAIRNNQIVSASGDAIIKLWDVETGACIREFRGHHRGLACVQFSEDAGTIVSGGNDQEIRVWDARTGECRMILAGHQKLVRTLHLDWKNRRIISGSYDLSVRVWNLDTGLLEMNLTMYHSSWILSAKADFRRIVSTSQDSQTLMLDFGAGLQGLEVLDKD